VIKTPRGQAAALFSWLLNELVAQIHTRMPVIIAEEHHDALADRSRRFWSLFPQTK
jgi:hypothetical protein